MRGTYRKRGRGWQLRIAVGSRPNGQPIVKTRTVYGDEQDAAAALAAWATQLGFDDTRGTTLAEALEAWYAQTQAHRTTRSNQEVRGALDRHLLPNIGRWRLDEVTAPRLERWYAAHQHEHHLSDGTIRHLHYCVRPALRLALRWEWLQGGNPADLVELGPLVRTKRRPPPLDAITATMAAAEREQPALHCYLRLIAATGCRRAEVAGLQRGDVDWLAQSLLLVRSLSCPACDCTPRCRRGRHPVEVKPTKTGRDRPLGLDLDTLTVLERHLAAMGRVGAAERPDGWVFPDLNRDAIGMVPLRPTAWNSRLNRLRASHDLPPFGFHQLRHWHASVLLPHYPVLEVSEQVGHARPSTTTDIYGTILSDSRRTMADRIATLLPRPAPDPQPD